MPLAVVATVHGYFSEKDLLLKQQVLLFLMIPVLLVLFFCLYIVAPGVMRTNMVEYSYFAVFSIALGFSIALAVENQRIYLESLGQEQRNLRDRLEMVREMHDNFGNVLSGIVRLAEHGERDGAEPAAALRVLSQVRHAAQNCLTDVRDFIAAGDPESSLWEDYIVQCRERAAEYFESLHIRLALRSAIDEGCETLRPPVRYHLTGILREALGNVVKHSKAGQVTLSLDVHAKKAELRIEDDGIGFDVDSVSAGSHGLANMAARAKELGGTLEIVSSEKGTRLAVDFIP